MGCIYRILNTSNGKSYVGQSYRNDPKYRYGCHNGDAFKRNSPLALHCAMRKYGSESFIIETLVSGKNKHQLNTLECYYAEQYQSYIWENGYNMVACGGGPPTECKKHTKDFKEALAKRNADRIWTEESRKKQSINAKNRGVEWNQKIAEAKKGSKMSEESKKKMSKMRKGVKKSEEWKQKRRIVHSDEWKQKRNEAMIQRKLNKLAN